MKLSRSLKSTHWVTWSSPLLLLVLVFTLTATSKSAPPLAAAPPTVTTSPTTISLAIQTPPTTTPRRVTKNASTPTIPTTTSTLITSLATTLTPNASSSSHKTDSNVKPVAVASGESVTSGELSGQLTPSFNVADVPLDGPGTWALATSAPVTATLQCASASTSVQSEIVIAARSSCQFIITPVTRSNSLTWQLTPVN